MKEVVLTRGKVALVDDEDFERVNQYKWHAFKNGRNEYAKTCMNLQMHRLILGITDSKILVDHIDHDGLDNRRSNLRICTKAQNRFNSLPNRATSSQYKGVSWCNEYKNWRSMMDFQGKRINLGRFKSEIEAAKAYDAKAKELFGEFAYLNVRTV